MAKEKVNKKELMEFLERMKKEITEEENKKIYNITVKDIITMLQENIEYSKYNEFTEEDLNDIITEIAYYISDKAVSIYYSDLMQYIKDDTENFIYALSDYLTEYRHIEFKDFELIRAVFIFDAENKINEVLEQINEKIYEKFFK